MPSPTEITVAQLSRLIGTPGAPVLIDVRTDEDFASDPRRIPTAFRFPYREMDRIAERIQAGKAVIICQKGKKLSQGVAATLRTQGCAAETLAGGFAAWRDAGEALVSATKISASPERNAILWVTRHRPKIDRIACPWLIRRFIDPQACFLFVPPAEVMAVASHFEAEPFDVEGVFLSHRDDRCTFDVMVEEFGLERPALSRLATVVRGADTNRHDLAPQAAGLLAISVGLSRLYRDDLEQLSAGLVVYDALYRWARDAHDEGHDWPSASTGAEL